MTRTLTIERTHVPGDQRAGWIQRARARREHYKRANCNYWVFEEVEHAGVFVEFTEAKSSAELLAARADAPDAPDAPVASAPLYTEVDLS